MTRMPSLGSGSSFLPGEIDKAELFDGSDNETVTTTDTGPVNGDIQFVQDNETHAAGYNSGETTTSQRTGWKITTHTEVSAVEVTYLFDDVGATEAYIIDDSDGSILHNKSITANVASFSFTGLSLPSGTYRVVVDDGGNSYDTRPDGSSNSFPKNGNIFDADGCFDENGNFVTGDNVTVEDITVKTPPPTSGEAYIEWPYPDAVFDWGAAFFEAKPDGETVNVYIEEFDGSTWNEIAGPIANTTDIPADPARNVRFRVEFSRTSTANNPRLLQIARQEVLADA